MTSHGRDDEAESRRILKQVDDPSAHGFLMHGAQRARDRFSAADVDPTDRIEVWGTRIGRTLGAGVIVFVVIWLFFELSRGG